MAKKIKKSDIDKLIKQFKTDEVKLSYQCGDDTIEVTVDANTDFEKYMYSMNRGITIMFVKDGTCFPQLKSFALNYALLYCFTDINLEDIVKAFNIVVNTNIVADVIDILPESKYQAFCDDFENMVSLRNLGTLKLEKLENASESVSNFIQLFGSEAANILASSENINDYQNIGAQITHNTD